MEVFSVMIPFSEPMRFGSLGPPKLFLVHKIIDLLLDVVNGVIFIIVRIVVLGNDVINFNILYVSAYIS